MTIIIFEPKEKRDLRIPQRPASEKVIDGLDLGAKMLDVLPTRIRYAS